LDKLTYEGNKMSWLHWLVLLISLSITFIAWLVSRKQMIGKVNAKFEKESERVVELVIERMKNYESSLRSAVALIKTFDREVTLMEWKTFSKNLNIQESYPGVNGIGIIYSIAPKNLDSFIKKQQKLRPYFRVHPKHSNKEYWPIMFIEPESTNRAAVGLDMAHEKYRFIAAKKAKETKKTQITGPIKLIQDKEKTPGFLFYVPYFNKKISL